MSNPDDKLSLTITATKKAFHRIIQLVLEAAELARSIGIPNLLQPGLIKELIIADILGHQPITSKRDADLATQMILQSFTNTCPAKKAVLGNLTECSKNHL